MRVSSVSAKVRCFFMVVLVGGVMGEDNSQPMIFLTAKGAESAEDGNSLCELCALAVKTNLPR